METPQLATKKGAVLAQTGVYESGEKVGRPFGIYKYSPEEIQGLADDFIASFDELDPTNRKVPTITEFAYKVGTTRKVLVEYGKRDGYSEIIQKVKAFCEMHTDQKLYDPDLRAAGAIFSLKANYGWKDGSVLDVNVNIGWNSVLEAAKLKRKMLEDPDYVPEPPIDID